MARRRATAAAWPALRRRPFSLISVVTALEHERVARLLHLGHHHGCRNLLFEVGHPVPATRPARRAAFAGGQEPRRSGGRLADLVGLLFRGLPARPDDDDARPVVDRELLDLIRRQDLVVEPQDRRPRRRTAFRAPCSPTATARPSRRTRPACPAERRRRNAGRHVESDAGRFAGSVGGQRDVIPLAEFETGRA